MKNKYFLLTLVPVLLSVLAVCRQGPDSARPNPVIPWTPNPPVDFPIPYDLHPLRAAVPEGFIRAADISHCYEIEQHGGLYRNADGEIEDIMEILTGNGINHARIRLWVDPDKNPGHYAGDGNTTTAVAKAIAVRAKEAGMGIMMDFHYSDWWANPATQEIPHRWKDIPTKEGLLDALYAYTKEAVEEFIEAGAAPDTVKIGNEITDGLLKQHAGGSAGGTGYALNGWQDYSDALKAAAQAVRDAAPRAKIVVHFGDGGRGDLANLFAHFTKRADGQAPVYTEVDYDILGLSWYPIWEEHLSIDSLYANIISLRQAFGKDVLLCETGYMWTDKNFDNFGNFTGPGNEEAAYRLMTNINGFTSDSGVPFAYRQDGTTRYIPPNPENQARVIRAIMDAVVSAGATGVMWWGADWFAPVYGLRNNAEMGALFDNEGDALPAMKVLGSIMGADIARPGTVTGLGAAPGGDTIILNWTAVNSMVASQYCLERAPASGGPWITVSDNLTGGSYIDRGLADQTRYFYRISAYNTNGWGTFCEPVETMTQAFEYEAPAGLRVSGTTAASLSLEWNPVNTAASYKIYGARSSSAPADAAYTLLAETNSAAYTHGGLTGGDTWWYTVSAVSANHGEGPRSGAVSATVGAALDFTAAINMTNALLDPDFLDSLKAARSGNCSTIMKTDGSNYQLERIFAANDPDYLYIALDYGKRPAMWQNDWITVWIDHTGSSAGGATLTGNYRVAQNQTISPLGGSPSGGSPAATIEFSFSHRRNAVTSSPAGTTVTKNTTWGNVGDNLWMPGAADFVIKYRIPLAAIAGAAKGDMLKILVSNTQGWSGGSLPVVGCVVPMSAVSGAFADSDTVNIDMENAMSYVVK